MRIEYLLPCSCGRRIPVQASQAGQQLECTCGVTLEVPAMRGLAQLEQADPKLTAARSVSAPETSAPPGTRQPRGRLIAARSAPIWGSRQRLLFVGALITALGLGLLAFLYITKPRLPEVDQLTPLGTWRLWRDLRHGLDWRPGWEEKYLGDVAANHRWMVVAAAIAALGVLTMVVSLLVSERHPRRPGKRPPPKAGPPRPATTS